MQNWTQKLNAHKPTFKTNSPEDYENCKTDFAGVASIQEYVVLGCNNCMVSFKEILMRNMSLIMFEIKLQWLIRRRYGKSGRDRFRLK